MRPLIKQSLLLTSLLLSGCSLAQSPWKLDAIAAGDPAYDSSRLVYRDPNQSGRLRLEFLRIGSENGLFLSLIQHTLTPSSQDPTSVLVHFAIEETPPFDALIPLHEGKMRMKIPSPIKEQITEALQKGRKVAILVDGFEETFYPDRFADLFEKFSESSFSIQNIFKDPY